MTIDLKSFVEQFRFFLKTSGKYILFTALFYSLWLVKAFFLSHDFVLHSFSGRMIGIATIEAYDVGSRVSTFYKSIGVLIGSFTFFNLIGYFFFKKSGSLIKGVETKIVNYSSLVGIFFLFVEALGFKTTDSMELVYFMHKLMVLAIFIRYLFFKKNVLSISNYTLISLLSISLYFFVADCFNLSGQLKNPDFLITTFIIYALLIIAINLFLKKENLLTAQNKLNALTYSLVPLVFLPFVSILKDEVFLVLRTNGIMVTGQLFIYTLLILILVLSIFFRHKKQKQISQENLISLSYFPVLIFSLLTFVNYSYYINYSDEVFEAGNKYLPIMEFKLFGVIPTIEKFNSHLLADYFYSGIYTFFSGLQGSEMELYDFLNASFSYVVYYFLIYYISRNAFVGAFCILLFPFCTAMLPESFAFGIFSIFALTKLISRQASLKTYVLFFLAIAALILWRIDLGYTCLVVMVFLLLYYHFASRTFKIDWILLAKALSIVLGSTIFLLALLSFYRDANLLKKSLNALNYFSSAQTYGYSSVLPDELASYGKMHFYIFPVLVGIIVIALLLNFGALNVSRKQRLSYLSLLFICGFYLVNFNRGLIRHSLMEWVDHFTSSYIYIIVPGTIYVFFHKKSQIFKFIFSFWIIVFVLVNYKLPAPTSKNSTSYFEKALEKIQLTEKTDLLKIQNRVKNKPSQANDKDSSFIDFINKNTSAQETFIDFSNNSMLYFYTKKISPSYFYQNPLCSHNDFLQDVFISDLKEYNSPYLLFSRNDDQGRDAVDDVPNTLRHYRMAEYFYQHYEPYILAGYLRIWKAKDREDVNKQKLLFSYQKTKNDSTTIFQCHFKQNKRRNHFARIETTFSEPLDLKVISGKETISPHLEYVNPTTTFCIIDTDGNNFEVRLKNTNQTILKFEILECDYIPDFYSEKFLSLNFMKLPYVWGTYDEKLDKEPILFSDDKLMSVTKDHSYQLKIPSNLPKNSGNTLILTCKNESTKIQKMILSFGNSSEKNKTKITFEVLPSNKKETYAIRISSIYKWYGDTIDELEISTGSGETILVSEVCITKGL